MAKLYCSQEKREFIECHLMLPRGRDPEAALLVYVHGFASHQRGEKVLYFRDRFSECGYPFLTFDHRGHGDSSGTMKELTVTRNLEDLGVLLAAHRGDYKHCILIGSSMGGQTAAWYAARYPDQVTANLLIAPGFRFLENRKRDLGPEGLKDLDMNGEVKVRNEWVEVTIGKGMLEDAEQYPVEKLLPSYRTPTLILHGISDDTVPYEDSVSFAERSSARPLELVLISGGDHRLSDYKETLFSTMQGFLMRLGL